MRKTITQEQEDDLKHAIDEIGLACEPTDLDEDWVVVINRIDHLPEEERIPTTLRFLKAVPTMKKLQAYLLSKQIAQTKTWTENRAAISTAPEATVWCNYIGHVALMDDEKRDAYLNEETTP